MPGELPNHIRNTFFENLHNLQEATALTRHENVRKLLSSIDALVLKNGGLDFLYENIGQIVESGFFKDTTWENPQMLNPSLTGGTLKAGGTTTLTEVLSDLRMLAYAKGDVVSKEISSKKAQEYLQEVVVNNLDLFFPDASEELRNLDSTTRKLITGLFDRIRTFINLENISPKLATELELMCQQRPVVTTRALYIIKTVHQHLSKDAPQDERLQKFVEAVYAPSKNAKEKTAAAYSDWLQNCDEITLKEECIKLGSTLSNTGLSSVYHAILVRLVKDKPSLLQHVLHLDAYGKAELQSHSELVAKLIDFTIFPDTSRAVYGLSSMLDRNLLSRQPVQNGLLRLMKLELHPEVEKIISEANKDSDCSPIQHILSDTICILGQPLGVGQGWNPTCQSARGISLWSSHAPGKLLDMVITAAEYNNLEMRFEGQLLASSQLAKGLTQKFDYNLDALSIVLVPHLDRIYSEMMNRAAIRGEDPHKWVNPAMYGQWIPTGFLTPYNYLSNSIQDYDNFIRIFYVTHHPLYNGGYDMAYPNPVGIFLTASNGKLLGFHAVSILRVAKNKEKTRIYFLNPNNEGRQKWQSDIKPTVSGNGERPGESSLPFHQFASRLYAFHYVQSAAHGQGEVPDEEIQKVIDIAKSSWGTSYNWIDKINTLI